MKKTFLAAVLFAAATLGFSQTLENGYYFASIKEARIKMGKTEVTQDLYEAVMGSNPSEFKGSKLPVEKVSWYDALVFCNKLSLSEGLTPAYSVNGSSDVSAWNYTPHSDGTIEGAITVDFKASGYRLPTNDEWRLAARANTNNLYSGSNSVEKAGWYIGNSANKTHKVGQLNSNEYGLYDMSGNVWEWSWNFSNGYSYYLGGSWSSGEPYLRLEDRVTGTLASKRYNNLGFRIVLADGVPKAAKQKEAKPSKEQKQKEAKPAKEPKEKVEKESKWKKNKSQEEDANVAETTEEAENSFVEKPSFEQQKSASGSDIDISVTAQYRGNIVSWDGTGLSVLELKNIGDSTDSEIITFDANFGTVGGSIGVGAKAVNKMDFVSANVWIKPLEWLKFSLGSVGGQSVAYPKFGAWAPTATAYDVGVQMDLILGGFDFRASVLPGPTLDKEHPVFWLDFSKTGWERFGKFWISTQYTFKNSFELQLAGGRNINVGAHGYDGGAASDLAAGVGFNFMPFGKTGFFGDAYASFDLSGATPALARLDAQLGGQVHIQAFMIQFTDLFQWDMTNFKDGFELKASYDVTDHISPYITFTGYEIMNKKFDVALGADMSVGPCEINANILVPVDLNSYVFKIFVPVQLTVRL